jgi:hypothetical protein
VRNSFSINALPIFTTISSLILGDCGFRRNDGLISTVYRVNRKTVVSVGAGYARPVFGSTHGRCTQRPYNVNIIAVINPTFLCVVQHCGRTKFAPTMPPLAQRIPLPKEPTHNILWLAV